MKWYDIAERNNITDENIITIRGFFLICLGVDLENLPDELLVSCAYYDNGGKDFSERKRQKVYLDSVVGTSYREYSGASWADAFIRLHRADHYIRENLVLRGKYFRMLKQEHSNYPAIKLTRDKMGRLFVDGNGNHRITFYKMMQFTDSMMDNAVMDQHFHPDQSRNRHSLYWLYADVRDEV